MTINSVIARGNEPHPSTTGSELVSGLARKFEQELGQMVEEIGSEDLSPSRFRGLLGSLDTHLNGIGHDVLPQILEERDEVRAIIEVGHVAIPGRCALPTP